MGSFLRSGKNLIKSCFFSIFSESQTGFYIYHSYVLSSFEVDSIPASIAPHCSLLIYKPARREEVLLVYDVFNLLSNCRCGGSSHTSLYMSVLSTSLSTCSCSSLLASPLKWQNLDGKALLGIYLYGILCSSQPK